MLLLLIVKIWNQVMIFGEAHCVALLLLLRDRQFHFNAQVIEENVMGVNRFLWGSMLQF